MKRRLAVLFGACLCVMAVGAPSASADPVAVTNSSSGEPCEAEASATTVYSTCEMTEVQGYLPIYSGNTLALFCDVSMDLHAGGAGELYGTNQEVRCGGYERQACTSGGQRLLWDGAIRSVGGGEYEADLDVCLEQPYGGGATQSIVYDLELTQASGLAELTQISGFPQGWFGGIRNSHFDVYDGDAVVVAEGSEEGEE